MPGHPSSVLSPREGGRAPRGASFWDPRDQNRGFHLGPVHTARIRLVECGSPIGAPPRCLKSGTVLPGPFAQAGSGRRHHPSPDRSTSSTSTTADPGNRRGRTMTRPPKGPGCPGPVGTAPAPSPNVFRKTPLWHERDNPYYAFWFSIVKNKIRTYRMRACVCVSRTSRSRCADRHEVDHCGRRPAQA